MRKDNVWKQAIALVLSAALVVGNGAPVSAAAGDTAAGNAGTTTEGTGDGSSVVENPDAYKGLEFDFEDGEQTVSGDDALYIENGITFLNQCSQDVATDDQGQEIATDENPNMSKGVEVVKGSDIPDATEEDIEHGKVLKFDVGKTNPKVEDGKIVYEWDAGIDYLTTTEGALASYDYSNGVTFSFDIRPEGQRDWDYLFAFGMFGEVKYSVTGAIGFIAGYDSDKKRQDKIDDQGSWQAYFPGGNWLEGNEIEANGAWDFFGTANADKNAHKWYNMKYIYTKDGLTIVVNDVPTVTYRDANGYMEGILQNMSKGKLRIGKGLVENFEGFVGYMDNVTIQPVHPGAHEYVDVEGSIEPASCTVPGSKKEKCSMCGVIATVEIPATGHTYVHHEAQSATCTEAGNIEHYTCSNPGCTRYFVSGDDGIKTTTSKNVAIDATGHDYTEVVSKKATPTEDGQITKTCKNCAEGTMGHSTTEAIDKVSNITLQNTSYTYTGKAIEPKVTVKDSKGNEIAADNYTVTYENNKNVGTAKAIIKFKEDSQKYQDRVERTFKINGSLSVNKTKVTLYTGKSNNKVTLKATIKGNSKNVEWKSDKPKVAKVDKKGVVTAVGAGKATITVKSNGVTKKVTVTVKNPTITVKNGKKKASSVTVKKGKKVTLAVTTNPKKAGSALAKLSAKDKKTASVTYKKGKITIKGKKKGSLKIKVTSGKAAKTITIKVK